jgi:hypothetical protein
MGKLISNHPDIDTNIDPGDIAGAVDSCPKVVGDHRLSR